MRHGLRHVLVGAVLLMLPSSLCAESGGIVITPHPAMDVRGDFQVGPTRIVLEMQPGDTRSVDLQITSREGRMRTYAVAVEDFSASDDGADAVQFYGQEDGPFSARSWLNPSSSSVRLQHGESAVIPVTISIPSDAEPGDHYAVVLVGRTETSAVSRVGALILITVQGDLVREGGFQGFSFPRHFFWSLPVVVDMQYRNRGTVHLVPTGDVTIKNILGFTVDRLPVDDWYVLRHSVRKRSLLWQPTFALGRYTATLTLNSAGQKSAETSTVSFWVIPVRSVVVIVVVIIGLSFLLQWFLSALRRR